MIILTPKQVKAIVAILEQKRRQYAVEYYIYQEIADPALESDAARYVEIDKLIRALKDQ